MKCRKVLEILRPLAEEYAAAAVDGKWNANRGKWRQVNSLEGEAPVIWVADFAWAEMPDSQLRCEDPLFRVLENQLRQKLFAAKIGDDMVSYDFNPDRIRKIIRRDLAAFKTNGCCPIIQMVGVMTVEKDGGRMAQWVRIVRDVAAETW